MTPDHNSTEQTRAKVLENTPGKGITPTEQPISPDSPEEFGLVQLWWGTGKGKTTAALGMGFRAAGYGYRVHMLQFMKGGASSVEATRGEYNAIAAIPGFSYENLGHYGWHGMRDGSEDADHERQAKAGVERAQTLLEAANSVSLTDPLPLDGSPAEGVHMLILDEIIYAAQHELLDEAAVISLVENKPDDLELILTGGHQKPDFLYAHADLVTNVRKEKHPLDAGQRARRGTEY